jgi:hypothetical protein
MSFADTVEPVTNLKAPRKPEELSKGLVGDTVSQISDWLSPSVWVLETIELATRVDPLEEALSWFGGDWKSYAKCGEAWANTGALARDIARNLKAGSAELDTSWNGNAADAAYVYFDELAKTTAALESDLKDLSTCYAEAAMAVSTGLDLVKGLLTELADQSIIADAELAAGSLFAETGVGAIMGYGAAALEIAEMARTWGRMTEAYEAAEDSVRTAVAGAGLVCGRIGVALQSLPEPGASYDNPAV